MRRSDLRKRSGPGSRLKRLLRTLGCCFLMVAKVSEATRQSRLLAVREASGQCERQRG